MLKRVVRKIRVWLLGDSLRRIRQLSRSVDTLEREIKARNERRPHREVN